MRLVTKLTHLLLGVFGLASLLMATEAAAFDFRLYRPTSHADGMGTTESGAIPQDLDLRTALVFDYGRRPLQALDRFGTVVAPLVVDRFDGRLMASVAYGGRVSLSFEAPVVLFQSGDLTLLSGRRLASSSMGDLSISPKIGILQAAQFGVDLALLGFITFPTGHPSLFSGNGAVTGGVEIDLSRQLGMVWLGSNFGAYLRPRTRLLDHIVGSELFARLALGVDLTKLNAKIPLIPFVELYGRTNLNNPFQGDNSNQLEANLGARVPVLPWLELQAGYARGLSGGVGAPLSRLTFGIVFLPLRLAPEDRPPPPREHTPEELSSASARTRRDLPAVVSEDSDGDGVPNAEDKCPERLGPSSKKGCPFLDTDSDGIEDDLDKCRDDAGPTKNYGCPLKDNDGDGFDDPVDKCPSLPEDKDGFQDDDGCPDDDNDKDGIADFNDKCPNQSEVINGVDDYDGCPDSGRALVLLTPTAIELRERINFKPGTAELDWKASAILRQVVALLVNHRQLQISVEAHVTDGTPAPEAKKLTEARADAVRQYLVTAGIDIRRLKAIGLGFDQPVVPHASPKAKTTNERVAFTVRGD